VIAPEFDRDQVKTLAEKLRSKVSSTTFTYQKHALNVTCSIGCATYGFDGDSAGELHRCADKRMYDDKQQRKAGR